MELEKTAKEGQRCTINEARAKIAEFIASPEADIDKLYFWQSVVIVLEAMVVYANRHADYLSRLAAAEPDPQRRAELEQIAEACRRVPEHPARTMREGMQAVVSSLLGTKLETPHLPGDTGRMDQYLWGCSRATTSGEGLRCRGRVICLHATWRIGPA